MNPDLCVVGLGYIGLPTASLLATKGLLVRGVDTNPRVVETIGRGEIHLKEPELDVLVRSAVNSGNLVAATTPAPAPVTIIAVPTPFKAGHQPDLSYVEAATDAVAPHLRTGDLVLLESTSPVGTTHAIAARLAAARPDLVVDGALSVFVAHCPERVLPGHILRELIENDRIVGGVDAASTEAAAAFYERFVGGEVLRTDARTAELVKLVENASRDVNIALANELSMITHRLGVDVWEVIRLANRHPRVNLLTPGPGVGGHCLAVDPWFIVSSAPEEARLIRRGREVNEAKTHWVIERVLERAARFRDPVVAVLGLTYKPDIDDLRESPALEVARALRERVDGTVLACDPNLPRFDEFPLLSLETCLEHADLVVILVAHRAFRALGRAALDDRIVMDVCGALR